jgi:hypothetical protein
MSDIFEPSAFPLRNAPTKTLLGDLASYYRMGGWTRKDVNELFLRYVPRGAGRIRVALWIVGSMRRRPVTNFGCLAVSLEMRRRMEAEEL